MSVSVNVSDEEFHLSRSLSSTLHNDIVPMINRYNWKHFVLFCKCKCEKEIVNDVNSGRASLLWWYICPGRGWEWEGFVWNYCSMSFISSRPPPLCQSLCFHVLLIIRLPAGLYWITPEAHLWDKWCGTSDNTEKGTLVKSQALQITIMWWISLKSSKPLPHEWDLAGGFKINSI